MTEIIDLFKKLCEYGSNCATWEKIEEQYDQEIEQRQMAGSQKAENIIYTVTSSPLVKKALKDPNIVATLLDLSSSIRSLRGEPGTSYDSTYDCWDRVIKVAPRSSYLGIIYLLAGLSQLDPTSIPFTKISVAAVNTYLLSLTISGAKSFHIFEESVIAHCLQVFNLIEHIQNKNVLEAMSSAQPIELWIRLTSLCDDLKLVLRYVHFNDHKETLYKLLKSLLSIQYINHERGYTNRYAANLHKKCFEIYDEVINPHNGDPKDILMKMMNMTTCLHIYQPKPKGASATNVGECEHISEWFIKCIARYPRVLVEVLSYYINSIVTNPVKTWKTEQTNRALLYAAKYDAALFSKCNASCLEFVSEAIYAEEVIIRTRCIELISNMLQMESIVDWQMFRHEVSSIPREVFLIKELIESIRDSNNTVKLRAVQALLAIFQRGSPQAKAILIEGIKYAPYNEANVDLPQEPRLQKNEIRFEKPEALEANYSFEGNGLVALSFLNMPSHVYNHLYRSPISNLRRTGVNFMEQVVRINPLVIFNTKFVTETVRLANEPVAMARKQMLQTIDSLLDLYPNCYPIVWVWCKLVAPMFQDMDPKNIEFAVECFRQRVLLNLQGIDKSNKAEHFMPWIIIRTLLSTQPRLYLQTCLHTALRQNMINTKLLSTIESHLITSNSTEAWCILNFVGGKVKSKEPDALIHLFISLDSWNQEQNKLIALEVLSTCIKDFSPSALNLAFNHILTAIKEGKIMPVVTSKAFDFLLLIDNRSNNQGSSKKPVELHRDQGWILELHQLLENKILNEVNLQTRLRPHKTVINFMHKYIRECIKLPEIDLENERIFNLIIMIAGRLSLRDSAVAGPTCKLYEAILRCVDRPSIVNTIIICITDLCKKHTHIVEGIIGSVLQKLSSPFEVNRMETFKCFEKLVLQDQLKLRGSLLLCLLATILDRSKRISERASEFFDEFLSKKNPTLFQKCLLECPYVLNEYKNCDGLDSFSEMGIRSPLKGDANLIKRHVLYNHLLQKIDEVNLIMYFGQLKVLAQKSQCDAMIKSPAGVALVSDIFFILKRICQVTKPQKPTASKDEEGRTDDAEVNVIVAGEHAATEGTTTSTVPAASKRFVGRGVNRREVHTMSEALTILEKSLAFLPIIYAETNEASETIKKYFNDLIRALWRRVPSQMEYAQPTSFWKKYSHHKAPDKNKSKTKTPNNRKRKNASEPTGVPANKMADVQANEGDANEGKECESECSDDSFSSECELTLSALASNQTRSEQIWKNNAELPMEYLFNPNI